MVYDFPVYISYQLIKNKFHFDDIKDKENTDL